VPFRPVGSEKPDAITGFDPKFDQRRRQAGNATEKFGGGNAFPLARTANHLRARIRQIVYRVEKARRKRTVIHRNEVNLPQLEARRKCEQEGLVSHFAT
jgi:hypothetical protein